MGLTGPRILVVCRRLGEAVGESLVVVVKVLVFRGDGRFSFQNCFWEECAA